MLFQVAVNPLSFICVVCGSTLPVKLGWGQLEARETVVDFPVGVNNNCPEPLRFRSAENEALLKSSGPVALMEALKPSITEPSLVGSCDKTRALLLKFILTSSFSPFT